MTAVGNAGYSKNNEMPENRSPTTLNNWPFRRSRIVVWNVFHFLNLSSSKWVSKAGTAGFVLNDHGTQIHSSFLTNRTETETFSIQVKKYLPAKSKRKHPDVKNGGAGRALLERNTGSWHSRGRELSYGTEAQVRGTGKFLIYKIDVWQNLDFQHWCLKVILISGNDSVSSSENSQLIK